ncbi:hypothetical protein RQP46_007809 [Phenoliferia psychrophenolica]
MEGSNDNTTVTGSALAAPDLSALDLNATPGLNALDVVLVGAGFAGTLMLWRLSQAGFKVHLVEKNSRSGGVWSWNQNDWKWTERFPSQPEILTYFEYVTDKLKLSNSTSYNTNIDWAKWDEDTKFWTIGSGGGATFRARRVVWCTGFFTKRLMPNLAGLDSFIGPIIHPGVWPKEGIDLAGKRVGIIGTGASGVQLVQTLAPVVGSLTVFQRTPNTALPMVQRKLPVQGLDKSTYPDAFRRLRETTTGFLYSPRDHSALDATPAERESFFEDLYRFGGFSFYLGSYNDVMTSIESNHLAYDFWRRKTWDRIEDKNVAAMLAPLKPLHSFGAKRPSLEQSYYECFNRSNVTLVDVRSDGIDHVLPNGIQLDSGAVHEFDVLVAATGYDAVTGSYRDLDVRGTGGRGFPNSFYVFGPQAPFANGPTSVETQTAVLVQLLEHMRSSGYETAESTPEADASYKEAVNGAADATVLGIGAGKSYHSLVLWRKRAWGKE